MKIQDKNIVVTGAASGIGKALAKSFSNHNANSIVLVDIDENALLVGASIFVQLIEDQVINNR